MRFLFLVIIFLFAIVIQSYPVDDGFEALPQLSGNGDALTSSVLQSPIENQFTTEALAGNPTSDLKEEFVDPQTEPQPEESIESQRGPQLEVLVPENPTSVLAETPTEPQEDLPDAAEQFDATAQCALATRSKERPSPAGRVLTKPECKPRRKWPHVDFSSENPVMENPIAVCCNDFPLHRADWHRHMQRVQNCVAWDIENHEDICGDPTKQGCCSKLKPQKGLAHVDQSLFAAYDCTYELPELCPTPQEAPAEAPAIE